jgi:CBS domain-containing protein
MTTAKRGVLGEHTPLTGSGSLGGGTGPTLDQSPSKLQALNWRCHLDVHPAADLFPLLSETDPSALKELAEDIRQHGQREPASYIKDSNGIHVLLDGRNRLDALEILGRKIDVNDSRMFEQLSSSIDAQAFIISKNIHRRHLKPEQKRELIGNLLKATPEKSDRQIAETVKASPTTVGTVRAKMEKTGDVSKLDTRRDTKGRKQPAKKQIQPKKSTSSDSSQSGVVPQVFEELFSGLFTGSDFPKTPTERATVVETQTQPNPIIAAWEASTLTQREEFIEDLGDFITDWHATVSARKKDAPLKYRIWNSCSAIEMGIDGKNDDGSGSSEYASIADQLSELEQDLAEEDAEGADPDDGIPDYLKRSAP